MGGGWLVGDLNIFRVKQLNCPVIVMELLKESLFSSLWGFLFAFVCK